MVAIAAVLFAVALWPMGDDRLEGLKVLDESAGQAGVCEFIERHPELYPDGCTLEAAKPRPINWGVLVGRVIVGWTAVIALGLAWGAWRLRGPKGALVELTPKGVRDHVHGRGELQPWDAFERVGVVAMSTKIQQLKLKPKKPYLPAPVRWVLLQRVGVTYSSAMVDGPFTKVMAHVKRYAPNLVA